MNLSRDALEGRFTRLEPLTPALREPLRAAISPRDAAWDIMASTAEGKHFDGWWDQAVGDFQAGHRVPYAVRRLADGGIVGTTSFLQIDSANRGVEIGSTFLAAPARSEAVNPDMKLTMLAHAFAQGALRVELRTDGRNQRSQAAIAKLGAMREGVLRKQKILPSGIARETVVFSVIDDDWPEVRARLEARLADLAPV